MCNFLGATKLCKNEKSLYRLDSYASDPIDHKDQGTNWVHHYRFFYILQTYTLAIRPRAALSERGTPYAHGHTVILEPFESKVYVRERLCAF